MSTVVLAIPHASTAVPDDVRGDYLEHVTPAFLRTQSDVDTDVIFTLPSVRTVRFEYSRFFVDPNRGEQQDNEGGVVPHTDFSERPLYREGRRPDGEEQWRRVRTYHRPYHARVAAAVSDPRTRFFIDGHSMSATAPVRSPDYGQARPDAVLSNLGDQLVLAVPGVDPSRGAGPLTCQPEFCARLAGRLNHWLVTVPVPSPGVGRDPTGEVRMNDPFPAGYGVLTHARPRLGIPGVQLELNQGLWCREDTFERIPGRIEWIREVMQLWIEDVVALREQWEAEESPSVGLQRTQDQLVGA